METKNIKPKQAVHISYDLFSRVMTLRAKLATSDNKLKYYQIIETAIEKYLEEVEE